MKRINEIIKKYLVIPKTLDKNESVSINEASGAGTSLINWTFWNRKSMIYVRNEEVLYSNTWEFPTGSEMSNETKQRARARGYIVIDW